MHRRFISTILAAAMTVTAIGASPARADSEDVAKALAAIAGIAILGKIISDSRDDDKRVVKKQVHRPQQHIQRHRHIQPRPLPHRVNRKLLPQHCLRSFTSRKGHRIQAFGARCLNRSYAHANRLPDQCLRSVRTDRGFRHAYGARCLRADGYRLARY